MAQGENSIINKDFSVQKFHRLEVNYILPEINRIDTMNNLDDDIQPDLEKSDVA